MQKRFMSRARRVARMAMIASVVLGAGLGLVARAESPRNDEMRRVFDQILLDPSNPGLNTRYAKMAADQGEYRKAIAAYERILARDPNNAEAKAAIAELLKQTDPPYTNFTFVVGSLWESNPRHVKTVTRNSSDFSFLGRATVSDERRIGGMRWRTEGDVSYLYYLNFKDIELGTVGARTGPMFDLADGYRIHPFVGLAYTALQRRTPTVSPSTRGERAVTTRGWTKKIASVSAIDW